MPRVDYDRLLQNISIDDVAKRLGMELKETTATQAKAICPFHDDKTPSLLIDTNRSHGRQHYYCFACGAYGDAIELVKKQLGLDFKAAVEWLAPNLINQVPNRQRTSLNKTQASAESYLSGFELGYALYKKAAKKTALSSWVKARNLDGETIIRAGFVHATNNTLSRALEAEADFSVRREHAGELEDAYLVRKLIPGVSVGMHLRLPNKYIDFFIGDRIIFPIHDERKKIVGLAGRYVGGSNRSTIPKYQFTRGFQKAAVLYRADYAFGVVRSAAKKGIKRISIFLCEGFLDSLRFESLGLPSVAVMGSNISPKQVQLLQELADSLPIDTTLNVVVSFDRDEAGLRGASDACLKLLSSAQKCECLFFYPTDRQLKEAGSDPKKSKDPNDYLQGITIDAALALVQNASYHPVLAVLAYTFSVSAEDTLVKELWDSAPPSRRFRAFSRALNLLNKSTSNAEDFLVKAEQANNASQNLPALTEWIAFISNSFSDKRSSLSEDFLVNARARLNHARILAYMGSRRGELPCDEPRWERLDIAATGFNSLLIDRLSSSGQTTGPIGSYNAVWVPRAFGGSEHRLKMMPRPEDLIIQQYLLNEILSERWDHLTFTGSSFSQKIPAVRYYKEGRRVITTGFDIKNDGNVGELNSRVLSFAYQIDMDVLEGRQPATDQGMYRPFHECWRDFMSSLTKQASEIGYVYSIRLDVKRYYDSLRRYVVRDRILDKLKSAIGSVTDDTSGFAELLRFDGDRPTAEVKASTILDRIDEHLFGVSYISPDSGLEKITDEYIGIPQGPVLSAWIGSIALFPVDEEASRFMDQVNTDTTRVGYARYVDDIVLLADDPKILEEMREAIDRCASSLKLKLLAKADEIPAMSAEDFSEYVNKGRAIAASVPAWEPPLIGDGEAGWEFWSVAPTTDRQSALHLLHNVELYKAGQLALLQTVKTAFQAADLRASELSKAARLIWYSISVGHLGDTGAIDVSAIWDEYLTKWNGCMQGAAWRLNPEKNPWESPILFALEGLEHLIDKESRDVAELSAGENALRRKRIVWLAEIVLDENFKFEAFISTAVPMHQLITRLALVRWKASRLKGLNVPFKSKLDVERSKVVRTWNAFEWMHEAVSLLAEANPTDEDPLVPFVEPVNEQTRKGFMSGLAANIFKALLPVENASLVSSDNNLSPAFDTAAIKVALQMLVSIVPKEHLLTYLNRRHHLIWNISSANYPKRLILPPLPGITTSRLFSCLCDNADDEGFVVAHGIEAIDFSSEAEVMESPSIIGSKEGQTATQLIVTWRSSSIEATSGTLRRLEADLNKDDYLRLCERVRLGRNDVTAGTLKQTAKLFRAMVQVVSAYAEQNDDKELVPAWPYVASSESNEIHYLVGDGVSREELGTRAFTRDGGRALRTLEVPIYEASLWRVGIAVSDYLGLHDDIAKFSSYDGDLALDATALASPARYILRSQLRKLRGAFANSQISKRHRDGELLPTTVERSLRLLETFPDVSPDAPFAPILHVLAAEAESAAMFLSFQERWESKDVALFLNALTAKVLGKLPLSICEILAKDDCDQIEVRRDLAGIFSFAKRLSSFSANLPIANHLEWRNLCSGVVSTGIFVAIDGLIASMRSHGSFERYRGFDFPSDWEIPLATPHSNQNEAFAKFAGHERVTFTEHFRALIQHMGHRLLRDNQRQEHVADDHPQERISDELYERFQGIAKKLATIDAHGADADTLLEWPFNMVSDHCLDMLNLELLESMVALSKLVDKELGFEVALVVERSYGYNAQTRRFTDSRNGVRDVTPWMISQFPRNAKHIEEISSNGRFLRVWSEVFDRKTGKLLSVSALGEPFASIAIIKPKINGSVSLDENEHSYANDFSVGATDQTEKKENSHGSEDFIRLDSIAPLPEESLSFSNDTNIQPDVDSFEQYSEGQHGENDFLAVGYEFRNQQRERWAQRSEKCSNGHIRIALLQADFGLTYTHSLVEACPSNWPFDAKTKKIIAKHLVADSTYSSLLNASKVANAESLWEGVADGRCGILPSWSEHRRRSILMRVIDSAEAFGVDLLILPEYSVRRETIEWLKDHLANKNVAVLAGTYMDFQRDSVKDHLTAKLTLLWPLPKNVSNSFVASIQKSGIAEDKDFDKLQRGIVLEFTRDKKYRSIALSEFFRPSSKRLEPLFKLVDLAKDLQRETGFEPSATVLTELLANTRLPLKYLLELICSEVFLTSSPANYKNMHIDLKAMALRFGNGTDEQEVFDDVRNIAENLSITGNGTQVRRSILAVPAATTRSADYWITGQATFLAAGAATVFCNSIGNGLVGGSCFIGCNSWKSDDTYVGYISRITPYHGWSKGIYYNDKKDALGKNDQAVVIVDIDPHNMLEGKPRAQTMPSPLQLVAYLPLIETVNWRSTEANLFRTLSVNVAKNESDPHEKVKTRPLDENKFWGAVSGAMRLVDDKALSSLWGTFPDKDAVVSRAAAYQNNHDMQPTAPVGAMTILSNPALYDWIDVSLTLRDGQQAPTISVPSWKRPKS